MRPGYPVKVPGKGLVKVVIGIRRPGTVGHWQGHTVQDLDLRMSVLSYRLLLVAIFPLTPSDSRACQALKLKYGRCLYDHEQLIMNFATSHDCIAIVITEQKRHRGMFRILVEH